MFLLEKNDVIYYFSLNSLYCYGVRCKKFTRSKIGRAFSAIRDRDIAAEALGINLFKFKMYAFALSSFYAGIAGSLLFTIAGGVEPGTFNLLYSIIFIAIVIIGGAGTVLGPLIWSFFLHNITWNNSSCFTCNRIVRYRIFSQCRRDRTHCFWLFYHIFLDF